MLTTQFKLPHHAFCVFFFGVGALLNTEVGMFFQQVKGPKALFLYHSRYCDSHVLITKLG